MFKLTRKIIVANIKWNLFLLLSFAIIISAVLSIFSTTHLIKNNIMHDAFNKYGKFPGVIVNKLISGDHLNEGWFTVIGELSVSNFRTIIVGAANDQFYELGHLKLLEGKLPENEKEVVIEAPYIHLIDPTWKVGEVREINTNNKQHFVKLVGILEGYTGKWSVQTYLTQFPNIIMGHDPNLIVEKANVLIPYNEAKSKKSNVSSFYSKKNNGEFEGFINDNLFDKGLYFIDFISTITFIIQVILYCILAFSLNMILSFYLTKQQHHFAVMKTVGASTSQLLKYTSYQISLLFFGGIILSIPFIYIYHLALLDRMYNITLLTSITFKQYSFISIFIFILYLVSMFITRNSYKKQFANSINRIYENSIEEISYFIPKFITKIRKFYIKQLLMQCFVLPKRTLVSLLTLTLSFLLVFLTITLSKESMNRLEEGVKYYLSSQLLSVMDTVKDHYVYLSKDIVFTKEDISYLEEQEGIAIIVKRPSMNTVNVSLNSTEVASSIQDWIFKYQLIEQENKSQYIQIPNVSFVIENEAFFANYNETKDNKNFPSAILYLTSIHEHEKKNLIGKTLQLSKVVERNNQYEVDKHDIEIVDVQNLPYIISRHNKTYTMDGFVLVLNEQFVLDNGLTNGYKDIEIIIKDNITPAQMEELDNAVQSILAITPGNMLQDVPQQNAQWQSFTDTISRIGQLAYISSLLLGSISLLVLLYGKFELRKRYWGIYRALGLTQRNVFFLFMFEATLYILIALAISITPILLFITFSFLSYPTIEFLKSLSFGFIIIFMLYLIYCLVINRILKINSISSLMRR